MTTFTQLCDSTLLYLHGFTTMQDQSTHLTSNLTSSGLSFTVGNAGSISAGVIEIGSELMWVDSIDSVSNTVTIAPYGRGFRGTTAAAHSQNDQVVTSPLFPRETVKKALNEAIRSVYPDLFGIAETTFTFNPAVSTYGLPAGAQQIIQVAWQTTGPSREWLPVRRWRLDRHASVSSFANGASISLYDGIIPGRTVRVVYAKQPTILSSDSDSFTDITGLPESSEDVVRLGAAYRLVPFFDAPHLSGASAEADFSANMRPVGGSSQLGRYLLQMYQVRLQEEARRLQELYPVRSHYTR
jgi:hypothetical protein